MNLIVNARSREALQATAEKIRVETGVRVTTIAVDVTTEAGRRAVLAACLDPDILISNAGGPPPGDFRNASRDDWVRAFDANMLTPISLIRAVIDGMVDRRFGRIVNITTSGGYLTGQNIVLDGGSYPGLM